MDQTNPARRPGRVAAVVVNYNAAPELRRCLESLAANSVGEVVVVDNGSVDDSCRVAGAAGVCWVETGANLGYGRAANRGAVAVAEESDEFLLVCNPDVELGPGSVAAMVAALDQDRTLGLVGPRIYNSDGSLYPSARTFPDLAVAMGHGVLGLVAPRNRFTRRYRLLDWDHRQAAQVDWVSGACFLIRRPAWESVGGFDPSYFMYLEDVDLCWRLHRAGWAVGYEPAAEVVHAQGVSTDRHPYRMLAAHHRSMWRFAYRTSSGTSRLALPIVAAGLVVRLALAMLEHRLGSAWPGAEQAAAV
jgi:N-acetylglucosaminyl-diphospho-decaprenol L-rhamnosyltransferase